MAADTEVIREFLVRLGFQVNETGSRRFDNTLDRTRKTAFATGKSIIGIGLAAQAMVAAFASSMEKMYYSSRRTGASVENIQALEFGSRKIGLAAGEAQGALENMAAAVRLNPGLRGLMDQLLGEDSSKMDQAQAMIALVQRLQSMPHYVGSQYAGLFGIDERTFLMLKDGLPELIKGEKERIEMNRRAGVNADDAARAAREYANSLRDLTERATVAAQRLSIELLPFFREFNELAVQTIDHIQNLDFSKIGAGPVSGEIKELNIALGTLVDTWGRLGQTQQADNFLGTIKTNAEGSSKAILQMITGLTYLASGEWKKGSALLLEGITGQVKNAVPVAGTRGAFDWINKWRDSYRDPNAPATSYSGESPADIAARQAGKARPAAASTGGTFVGGAAPGLWERFKEVMTPPSMKQNGTAPSQKGATIPSTQKEGAKTPRGIRNNNPGNLEFQRQAGATSDGRFARFDNPAQGLQAMAGQLDRYNERGLNTIAKVITKWAPPTNDKGKIENDTPAYIDYVKNKMGVGANEKIDLKDPTVLSKLMGAMIGKENGYNPYDEFQLLSAAQARVGEGRSAPQISQKVDIHVAAGPNAEATGAAVARAQSRVNGDMVRNLQGSIQ
jgi:hypothetical protein